MLKIYSSDLNQIQVGPIKFNVALWNEKIQGTIYCG